MDKIKDIVKKFSRVLLTKASESTYSRTKGPFKVVWSSLAISSKPHLFEEQAKCFGKLALESKRVFDIQLLKMVVLEEIFNQLW